MMVASARRLCLIALAVVVCAATASADAGFLDFASPSFMAGGASATSLEAPFATLLNPAAPGGRQRVTVDLSYIGLMDFAPSFLWGGHVVNVGATIPKPFGVISALGRFATAGFTPSLNWGTLGGLHLAFAKDLFPDFYVGLGLGFEFGSSWGLWGDLGIMQFPGDLGFLKDFRWGVALRGLGKGYAPAGSSSTLAWPPAFTPALGASFALVKSDPFLLTVTGDLSFPSFQDVRLMVGLGFTAADLVTLNLVTNLDLRQALGTDPIRSLPLGFGLSVKIKTDIKGKIDLFGATERGWNQSEFKATSSAMAMQSGIWAIGLGVNASLGLLDRNPPIITIDTEGERYISPNFDGTKDDLTLPLAITDERYVKGFKFLVVNSEGTVVRTLLNKEDRAENLDIGNLWQRFLYVKKGIPIPETVRWDGKSDAGAVVADGRYQYLVEAWDDNGNTGRSGLGTVVVDDTPPTVSVTTPYLIFSPNGDGNKDTLPLEQTGSTEDSWVGVVRDIAGTEVARFSWDNKPPASFEWDGKGSGGTLVADGVYSYRIGASDRAGNAAFFQVDNIILNTQETPIQLSIDLSYFSPNGDGVKDTVTLTPQVPVTTGVEQWKLTIADAKGVVRRTFSGKYTIPATIAWDGKDDAAALLPEATYQATLALRYVNGNAPTAASPSIAIDVTSPSVVTKGDLPVFSPNGDGNKDTVTLYQETSEELFWTGTVRTADGKDVRTMVWRGRADSKFTWDGRADDGSLLPDGEYAYSLASTDRAGNSSRSTPVSMRIDTEETPVIVATDLPVFSPNGDGIKDRIRILPTLRVATGVDAWTYRIRDERGTVVRTFSGKNKAPEEVFWDGIDDAAQRAKDGRYAVELEVTYANGNQPRATSSPFQIDTAYPEVSVSAPALLFSPDGDGRLDTIEVKQSSSDEELWEGEIRDAKAQKVRGFFWKGKATDFTWDGKDENGNRVPDGYYSYVVRSQRASGNATTKELRGIQVDTRPTVVYITPSVAGFSPNGDGVRDEVTFNILVGVKDGIKSWKVSAVHPSAGVQREWSGTSPVPASLAWDGKRGYETAPEGLYTAILTVEYAKGNRPEARTSQFRLDVTPPKVDIALAPEPFSPDNDGVDDELAIGLKVTDASALVDWELSILDPQMHRFNHLSGKGAPSEKIIWDGTSDTGELVQAAEDYTIDVTVRDELGKVATSRAVAPVDVLVIREGDRLKIRIPSITFAPNTPDYISVDAEKAEKNQQVIARLAQIFTKYSKYQILIVGHANRDKFDPDVNPAGAKKEQDEELLPLSRARAAAIKDALVLAGIDARRITTDGVGGAEPVVPFADRDNWWKNRRVEFILVKG